MDCRCFKKLLGIQSAITSKEEILDHYVYIAKLLLEVTDRLELLKKVSDAQLALLIMTEKPGMEIQHNCQEMRSIRDQIGSIVDHWKTTNTDDLIVKNLENNLDEDFEALERQHQYEAVGNHFAMWEPIFNHEALKENCILEQEKNIGITEGWGIEDDPDDIAMEEEDEGPSHGNRNLEKIEYHRYRAINRSNPDIVVATFKCYWTGEINRPIESLETVMQAPRAIRGYIRNISKRARNQLLKRHPELEKYRPISDTRKI